MSVELIEKMNGEATFSISIDAKTFADALLKEYYAIVPKDQQPKGYALMSPSALLSQFPEREKLANEALQKLLPEYYAAAIKTLKLQPVTYPDIRPQPMEFGRACAVKFHVVLEPEIELIQYEGLEAIYTPVIPIEDDIERKLANLRKQFNAEDDVTLLKGLPFDNIEAFQEELRRSAAIMAKERTGFHREEALVDRLIAANPFDLREEVIEQHVMLQFGQYVRQMGGEKVVLQYMKSSDRTMEDIKEEIRPEAERTARRTLLLNKIADKLDMKVTEDDIREVIMAQQASPLDFSADYETRRKNIEKQPGMMDQIRQAAYYNKAMVYVTGKTVFIESEPVFLSDDLPEYLR